MVHCQLRGGDPQLLRLCPGLPAGPRACPPKRGGPQQDLLLWTVHRPKNNNGRQVHFVVPQTPSIRRLCPSPAAQEPDKAEPTVHLWILELSKFLFLGRGIQGLLWRRCGRPRCPDAAHTVHHRGVINAPVHQQDSWYYVHIAIVWKGIHTTLAWIIFLKHQAPYDLKFKVRDFSSNI